MSNYPKSVTVQKFNPKDAGAIRHVRKEDRLRDNHSNDKIDKTRTPNNRTYIDQQFNEAVAQVFGGFIKKHDEKQRQNKRPSRQFGNADNYAEKLKKNNKIKPYVEFVFAIGSSADLRKDETLPTVGKYNENLDTTGPEWTRRTETLDEFATKLPEKFPNMHWYQVALHLDESNPHIHAFGIPYVEDEPGVARWSFNDAINEAATARGWIFEPETKDNGKQTKPHAFAWFMNKLSEDLKETYQQKTGHNINQIKKSKNGLQLHEYKEAFEPFVQCAGSLVDLVQMLREKQQKIEKALELLDELTEEQTRTFKDAIDGLPNIDEMVQGIFDQMAEQIPDDAAELLADIDWKSFENQNAL